MKKLSRLISALVAVVLMLTMVSASAPTKYEVMDDAIYIATASVPEDATAYALDMFSHLSAEFVASLGFTYEEACSMRVANGFCAYAYDDTVDCTNHCYYPVLVGNEIVSLITVSYSGGEYSFKFGASKMIASLSELQTSSLSPVKVVISQDAFYGVIGDDIYLLSYISDYELEVVEEQMEKLKSFNDTNIMSNLTVVCSENIYDKTVVISADQTDSNVGMIRSVPIVDNVKRYEDDGTYHSTCWASCATSLYCYYTGTSSNYSEEIRKAILDDYYASAGTYYGGIYNAKSILENEISGLSLTVKSSCLSWSEVKTAILTNDAPCYMRWEYDSGKEGHAMVLCGYYYDSTYPNDSSYYYIKVMDPNESAYQSIQYGGTYPVGSNNYTWVMTLVKN